MNRLTTTKIIFEWICSAIYRTASAPDGLNKGEDAHEQDPKNPSINQDFGENSSQEGSRKGAYRKDAF
ncbi:hypothetical protein ABI_36250 [Asticcacaulis biprosthecium C19]|uniref:Uncharacterized protein n=1 Tax=Asticcacaulis biprosthecium C19 TaxID=715226 RepID=F4QQV9_9CAUL|nr:hypothetical protein ABI_36250 [Asticcacaulis biprosthecium C19]